MCVYFLTNFHDRIETSGAAASKPKPPLNRSKVQDRSRLSGRYNAADLDAELASLSGVGISDTESAVSRGLHSGSVTRGQDPYDMDADLAAMESIDGGNSTPVAPMSSVPAPCLALAGRGLSETLSHSAVLFEESDEATKFARLFPDMRQAIMGAVLEINEDLDNLHGPISDQAQEHIHEGECVLIYGYATLTESFLKAAARKRKFQVIIAEAEPSISGLKLAVSLAKASNNISVTLVPDSNIYALMSRVNKVIIAPHAVMIDGGCVCSAGHLMVAIAARDHSVPVVCLAGTYIMTPLLAHNQRGTLEQLLSPALVIPYHAPVNFDRTEVFVPAFDSVGPDLVALFVTNNGSHQPSYIYRLLGELYHPDDYAH